MRSILTHTYRIRAKNNKYMKTPVNFYNTGVMNLHYLYVIIMFLLIIIRYSINMSSPTLQSEFK